MRSNAGFSLVGVLIILGVSLTAVLLISQSQTKLRQAGKALDSSESFKVFITSFTDFIQTTLNDNMNNLCAANISGLNSLQFNNEHAAFTENLLVPESISGVLELKNRCAKSQFNASGVMYFCLQLDKNSAYPKDEFGGADYNIIEVLVRPVDKLQQAISCSHYNSASNGTVGLQIFYRLFWIPKAPSDKLFQKYGFYYAIKE